MHNIAYSCFTNKQLQHGTCTALKAVKVIHFSTKFLKNRYKYSLKTGYPVAPLYLIRECKTDEIYK